MSSVIPGRNLSNILNKHVLNEFPRKNDGERMPFLSVFKFHEKTADKWIYCTVVVLSKTPQLHTLNKLTVMVALLCSEGLGCLFSKNMYICPHKIVFMMWELPWKK